MKIGITNNEINLKKQLIFLYTTLMIIYDYDSTLLFIKKYIIRDFQGAFPFYSFYIMVTKEKPHRIRLFERLRLLWLCYFTQQLIFTINKTFYFICENFINRVCFELLCTFLKLFWTFLNGFGRFWTFFRPFRIFLDFSELSELFWTFLDFFELFWTF